MTGAQDDAVKLISGLLSHIRQVVGEGASYAMLHYGAVEEGKRLGAAYTAADLPDALARLDGILIHHSEVLKDDGDSVTIRVRDSRFLATGHRAAQGVVVGLLEGCLGASRHGRFKGQVAHAEQDDVTIELKREG